MTALAMALSIESREMKASGPAPVSPFGNLCAFS